MQDKTCQPSAMWEMKMEECEHQCKDENQLHETQTYQRDGKTLLKGYIHWINNEKEIVEVPIVDVTVNSENKYNVLSIPVIMNKGFSVRFYSNKCGIFRKNKIVIEGKRIDNRYLINVEKNIDKPIDCNVSITVESDRINLNNQKIDRINEDYEVRVEEINESEITLDAVFVKSEEEMQNEICDEDEQPNEIYNGDSIRKIIFDDTAVIDLNLELDWPTNHLSDDEFFGKCKYDSYISSMDIIIMNSLSIYFECERLKSLKSLKVSKHLNVKVDYERSDKTDTGSPKHKHHKQPEESSLLLQSSLPLPEDTVYIGKIDNCTTTKKIKYKRKKSNFRSGRICECDVKLLPDEGLAGSDVVLLVKPPLEINVTNSFMCLNSELVTTSPFYGKKISLVMNECPEVRQELFQVFSLLHMNNSTRKEERQPAAYDYNRQPSTEEHHHYLCTQQQAIADFILKEIIQSHLKTIKCKLKIRGASQDVELLTVLSVIVFVSCAYLGGILILSIM